ncbi:MAG: imidazolonepropionase [Thermoplasmata archaeon]
MKADILIRGCNELHTLSGGKGPKVGEQMMDTGCIKKGAFVVKDGLILDVGEELYIQENYHAEECLDATGKTVVPGFVDPHTHLVFSGSREDELVMKIQGKTYMEILDTGGGILRTVRKTREATKEQLMREMKKRMDVMLAHGTTTAEAKSGYGLDLENEIKCLEAIKEMEHPLELVPTYMGAHALPPEFQDHSEYIDYCCNTVLPEISRRDLAQFCDVFCEKGVFDAKDSMELLIKAAELGMGIKVHADEIKNIGCSTMAAELGAVSCEHLVKSSSQDIKAMTDNGIIGILLPGTPFMLMDDEYPSARKMIDNRMPIALATDLNPNCWTESMQMVITLACLQMKMLPQEALTASTYNAARAIRRYDIGSIEPGKKADFVVLDIPNLMHLPYRFGVNLVENVFKGGKQIITRETSKSA